MNRSIYHTPRIAALMLAALLLAGLAPMARADHDHGRRYKGEDWKRRQVVEAPYWRHGSAYTVRRSSAGPAIAGFLGGLFLGATLSHAAPAGYSYYDPYCDERFATLEIYRAHLHHHHHAAVVRVIESNSGDCVDTYRYQGGHWNDGNEDSRNWDDGDDD